MFLGAESWRRFSTAMPKFVKNGGIGKSRTFGMMGLADEIRRHSYSAFHPPAQRGFECYKGRWPPLIEHENRNLTTDDTDVYGL
jgi:hypothetical protein